MSAFRRGFRASAAATTAVAAALLASACSGSQPPPRPTGKAAIRGARAVAPLDPALALRAVPAPYQLPAALSREVVLPAGNGLLIIGGLTRNGATADTVTRLNPVTGATSAAGRLATPAHDAAGAMLGGRAYVFGGGASASTSAVQAMRPGAGAQVTGRLPASRSDVTAVTAGTVAYLLGGYDGTTLDPTVLATTDGRHFRTVARLPVPVRYGAAAAGSGSVWVFGGQTASGAATDVIQRIDPADGKAVIAGHLPQPLRGATAISLDGQVYVAGGATARGDSQVIYRLDPATSRVTPAGTLPVPVAYAAGAVAAGVAYLVGGEDGQGAVPAVTTLRLVPSGQALPGRADAPWLAPASGPGHLAHGSDPAALPADVLIADHQNNRLLIVDPQGRVRWEFPRPGDLAPGQTFLQPDDAFFSPDGKYIVVTQEDDQVISVISLATSKITYRFGVPGVPGAGRGHLSNPDDAMLAPGGDIIAADIKNCRIVVLTPPARTITRVIGTTQGCGHAPPRLFGSPNGAFPLSDGKYLVTEINGDWADEMSLGGAVAWSAHPPGVAYPSDTNEVYPGRYLTADYSNPGQIVEFSQTGRLLWRLGGLNQPSLAEPLPNGDIIFNDDFNDRVCVVDPATGAIVWQYGHTGVAGHAPGYLNDPDGLDLVPPDSLAVIHAATMGKP